MSEKLKPCPHCGGEAKEFTGEDAAPHRWTVECDRCGAHVGSDTRHKARAKWNRRAERTCRMGLGKLHYEWVCLACGKHYHWHEIRHAKYCPDCGAKIENEGWGNAD